MDGGEGEGAGAETISYGSVNELSEKLGRRARRAISKKKSSY